MKRAKRPSRRSRRGGDEPEQVLYHPGGAHVGETVSVAGAEALHASQSLRLRTGDPIALIDGRGLRHHGTVVDVERGELRARIERSEEIAPWPGRPLWLAAGVLRTARMETLVEKASELGVDRFFPLLLKHCVARPGEDGLKVDRWHRIAVESLKQSKRRTLLPVEEPLDLDVFLARIPAEAPLWFAHPGGDRPPGQATGAATAPLILVVGPEGGLSEEEVETFRRRGGTPVHLGGHRLRAETAGIALTVLALAAVGGFDD